MATSPRTTTASSSITAADDSAVNAVDIEAQAPPQRTSHFNHIFDQAGVTPEVLNHKYPGEGTAESPYLVDFLPVDPRDPTQFAPSKKWTITALQAIATLAVAFVSTAYSGGITEVIMSFRVSTTVAILGISLFVCGFALGPLLWAPLSEFYGRQILFFATYMTLTAFNAGAAGAQNIETLIILRFFAGTFGASPLTNSGGVIADMFSARERGLAGGVFAMAPFLGPSIGPIVGGFLGEAEGWRWVEGLMAIFTGVLWIACSLYVPETYAPVLLRKRAAKLSQMTGKVYVSKVDAYNKQTKAEQVKTALLRPWILLLTEPIVLLTSIYIAIIYGTLYLLFAAFPIVFQLNRGWTPGISGLAFCGVAVGMIGAVGYVIVDNRRYNRVADRSPGGVAPPEARLPLACVGSVLLPVGLFWFAWTNGPEVHWVVPIVASGFFAAGLVMVFLSLMGYLIDSYVVFAASVLAANSVLRSLFGAAFPLFATEMYKNLGIHWASTVPAFLALACVPFPFLFYKYGDKIRMRCKYAAEAAAVLKHMMQGRASAAAAAAGGGGGNTPAAGGGNAPHHAVVDISPVEEEIMVVKEDSSHGGLFSGAPTLASDGGPPSRPVTGNNKGGEKDETASSPVGSDDDRTVSGVMSDRESLREKKGVPVEEEESESGEEERDITTNAAVERRR